MRLEKPPKAAGVVSGWLQFFLGNKYFANVDGVGLPLQLERDVRLY